MDTKPNDTVCEACRTKGCESCPDCECDECKSKESPKEDKTIKAVKAFPKQLTKTFAVIKAVDVKKALGLKDGNWAIATTESPDAVGDVVIVDGVNVSMYHNDQTKIKILAQHMRASEVTGEDFVIGRVEEFTKVMIDGVKALAFRWSWAGDGTKLFDLAAKYAEKYDAGYLDSFSVGMLVNDAKGNDGGGYDYLATTLYEISAVSVPANAKATVIRSIELNKELSDKIESTCNLIKQLEERLMHRMDVLESNVVSADAVPQPNDQKEQLKTLTNALKDVTRLGNKA